MIPLSDGIPARRFPYVNVALIAANFAVWLLYELPHLRSSVFHASFYPCTVSGACHGPEDAFGHVRYLAFYVAGGFVASMTQALITLLAGTAADGRVPTLGASGAIAAVLGAYFVLYPTSRVRTLVIVFLVRIPAWVFLGAWFLCQLVEGDFGLMSASANGGGVAFFADVGGFVFGYLAARLFAGAGAQAPATASA